MNELTFEGVRDFIKSLTKDEVRELRQLVLDESYQQRDDSELKPDQES